MVVSNQNPSYSLILILAFQTTRIGLYPSYSPICLGVISVSQINLADDRLCSWSLFSAFDAYVGLFVLLDLYL